MRFKIQIEFDKILMVDVSKSIATIGRSSENDVIISSSSVSRKHCLIEEENEKYFVTDLDSYNGTYIDGIKLRPGIKTQFQKRSMLTIGKILIQISKIPKDSSKDQMDLVDAPISLTDGNHKSSITLKIGRLELHQPSLSLKLEKENKIKGPKNPASEHFKSSYTKKNNSVFSYLFILISFCLFGALYYFFF